MTRVARPHLTAQSVQALLQRARATQTPAAALVAELRRAGYSPQQIVTELGKLARAGRLSRDDKALLREAISAAKAAPARRAPPPTTRSAGQPRGPQDAQRPEQRPEQQPGAQTAGPFGFLGKLITGLLGIPAQIFGALTGQTQQPAPAQRDRQPRAEQPVPAG